MGSGVAPTGGWRDESRSGWFGFGRPLLSLGGAVGGVTLLSGAVISMGASPGVQVQEQKKMAPAAAAGEPIDSICMACADPTCVFKPRHFKRRPVGPKDVLIDLKYCGVCHSDLHFAANHFAGLAWQTDYSCTPGHEMAGVCVAVGSEVTRF